MKNILLAILPLAFCCLIALPAHASLDGEITDQRLRILLDNYDATTQRYAASLEFDYSIQNSGLQDATAISKVAFGTSDFDEESYYDTANYVYTNDQVSVRVSQQFPVSGVYTSNVAVSDGWNKSEATLHDAAGLQTPPYYFAHDLTYFY